MATNTKTNITSNVLLVVFRNQIPDGSRATEIRVVDWITDTGKHYPQLEKREMFVGEDGAWKMGKAKGMNLADLLLVRQKWNDVMVALGSKLPEHVAAANPPASPKAQKAADGWEGESEQWE